MRISTIGSAILTIGLIGFPGYTEEFHFIKHTINDQSAFEACGVGDINRDGRPDVMSGDTWYEATGDSTKPWIPHHVCDIVNQDNYYHDFANVLEDVDGDGCLDVVSCAWHTESVLWRKQPSSLDQTWESFPVAKIANMETGYSVDLNGDAILDFFPSVYHRAAWLKRLAKPQDGQYWYLHEIGPKAGHGGGTGDVDGDGDVDVVVQKGWYEHLKVKRDGDIEWLWHEEAPDLIYPSVPIVIRDYTGDGLPDIVFGMGHDFGVYWLEQQKAKDGGRTWLKHEIDTSWSQAHCVLEADLNGDGVPEAVTGKRRFAHNGRDPGGYDPLIVCIYEWNPVTKNFDRHIVDQGSTTGFGLYATIADVDLDGELDIVCPGKSGLYWFENTLR